MHFTEHIHSLYSAVQIVTIWSSEQAREKILDDADQAPDFTS